MCLLVFFIQTFIISDKQRQVILIDLICRVIPVLPDKAALLAVLRDHRLPELFILEKRIQIEYEHSARIQIIVHKSEYLQQIRLIRNIVHRITDTHNRPHGTVQLKFPHILLQI